MEKIGRSDQVNFNGTESAVATGNSGGSGSVSKDGSGIDLPWYSQANRGSLDKNWYC